MASKVEATHKGNAYCPWCGSSSFNAHHDEQIYYCFKCGRGGSMTSPVHLLKTPGYDKIVADLYKAVEKLDRHRLYVRMVKNLATTVLISVWFFTCLTLLGLVGYLPAIVCTAAYFTWRDHGRRRGV